VMILKSLNLRMLCNTSTTFFHFSEDFNLDFAEGGLMQSF
jgi:hypothetical protein